MVFSIAPKPRQWKRGVITLGNVPRMLSVVAQIFWALKVNSSQHRHLSTSQKQRFFPVPFENHQDVFESYAYVGTSKRRSASGGQRSKDLSCPRPDRLFKNGKFAFPNCRYRLFMNGELPTSFKGGLLNHEEVVGQSLPAPHDGWCLWFDLWIIRSNVCALYSDEI